MDSPAKDALLTEILKLGRDDRIELVHDIWDSIADEWEGPPLTDEERRELDRRFADHEANPGTGIPWSEVRAELLREEGAG